MEISGMKRRILESTSIDGLKVSGSMPPLSCGKDGAKYIVVCYPQADYKCVYCDLLDLSAAGVKYWYDNGLSYGKSWEEELASKIQDPLCSGVMFYLSKNSFNNNLLYEIKCTKNGQGNNNSSKNYFSVNISGKNVMELFFAGGFEALKLTQEGVSAIFNAFSSDVLSVKRSENQFECAHIPEIVRVLEERFGVVCKEDDNEKKKREIIEKLKELIDMSSMDTVGAACQEIANSLSGINTAAVSEVISQILNSSSQAPNNNVQPTVTNHVNSTADSESAEGLYQKAKYYDNICDYETGAQYYLKAAEAGHPEAQYQVAEYYLEETWGFPHDPKTATMWYKRAADQGHARAKRIYDELNAQRQILGSDDGTLSAEGLYQKAKYYDNICDYETGAQYYLKAAEAGHPEAQCQIAEYYLEETWDFPHDPEAAIMWYKRAADQGHARAKKIYDELNAQMQILGTPDSMLSAEGLYQKAKYYDNICEYETGAQYHLKAAEAGHPEAQCQIAEYYLEETWDFPHDPKAALMWYKKAADQGNAEAKRMYDKLTRRN